MSASFFLALGWSLRLTRAWDTLLWYDRHKVAAESEVSFLT